MHTTVDGVELEYRDEGRGRPVVLVHGLGSTLNTWEGVAESLTSTYRVVRIDLRGSGRSDVPEGPYSIERLVKDVLGIVDELELDAAHFVGHSLGSIVCMRLAIEHPDRVRTLSLAAAGPGMPDERKAELEDEIADIEAEGMRAHAADETDQSLSAHTKATRPEIVGLYREMISGNDPAGYVAQMRALMDADLRGDLDAIDVPTLLIAADQDAVTPPLASLLIANKVAHSNVTILPDVGHMAHLEAPAEVARAVQEFLANV